MPSDPRPVPPRSEISRELSASFTVLHDALRHARYELERDVLIWQRWLRYLGVAATAAVLLFAAPQPPDRVVWIPVVTATALYILFTAAVGAYLVRRYEMPRWVPDAMVAADLAATTALVYLSAPPTQYHRILYLGFLVLVLSAFYFGHGLGFRATAWALAAYVIASLVAPPYVPGERPLVSVVAVNASLFFFAASVIVGIFGDFRERMNRFRLVCKRAEMGDLGGTYDSATDRLPDDLTLLGRSFNDMRGRLVELIGTDPLTGCLNRRALEERLGREWRLARRRGDATPLAVLAVDVDHFKQINDGHGHAAGDHVLQELGEILRATARDTDTVARVGGDEFVVILPDTGWEGATIFAERLRRAVGTHGFVFGGRPLAPTLSVGVHVLDANDPEFTLERLLEGADRSLYRAKAEGRNRTSAQQPART